MAVPQPGYRARRSQLIREMTRDLDRTENSIASSTGSNHGTVTESTIDSDFNYDRSRPIFDFESSQQLPPLRKSTRSSRFDRPHYRLNTERMKELFPDMMGEATTEGDFTEIARMAKARARGSPPLVPLDLPTVSNLDDTREVQPRHAPLASVAENMQSRRRDSKFKAPPTKENIVPSRTSDESRSPYVSGATLGRDGEYTRQVSELHAKVRDEFDKSIASENPMIPPRKTTPTSSRFDKVVLSTTPPSAEMPASLRTSGVMAHLNQRSYVDYYRHNPRFRYSDMEETPSKPPTSAGREPQSTGQTQNSFIIPRVADYPDLVTGARNESTNSLSKSRASRFASSVLQHNDFNSVSLPETDKKLFAALQEAEDRVQQLEVEKAGHLKSMEEMRKLNTQLQTRSSKLVQENQAMKTDVQSAQTSNKALTLELKGLYESHNTVETRVRKLKEDKQSLELEVQILQQGNQSLQSEIQHLERYRRSDSAFGSSASEHRCCECVSKITEENSKLLVKFGSLEDQLAKRNDQCTTLSAQIAQSNEQCADLEAQIAEKHEQCVDLEDQIAERNEQCAALDAQIVEYASKAIKQTDQLNKALEASETLRNDNSVFCDQNDSLRAQLDHYEAQVQDMVIHWQGREQDLKNEIAQLKEASHETILSGNLQPEGTDKDLYETNKPRQTSKALSDDVPRQSREHQLPRSASDPHSSTENITASQTFRNVSHKTTASDGSKRGRPSYPELPSHSVNRPRSRPRSLPQVTVQEATQSDLGSESGVSDYSEGSDHGTYPLAPARAGSNDVPRDKSLKSRSSHYETDTVRSKAAKAREAHRAMKLEALQKDDTDRFSMRSQKSGASRRRHSEVIMERDDDTTSTIDSNGTVITTGTGRQRRHSENSIHEKTQHSSHHRSTKYSKHPKISVEDLTSAFIAPDLKLKSGKHPSLTPNAKKVLNNLVNHDEVNCTYCARVSSFDKKDSDKRKITVERPIPISDGNTSVGATMDPGMALARVLKMLSDELAHHRMTQAQHQAIYNQYNASKTDCLQRNRVSKKLEKVQNVIDRKSDHVYYLYQVLEGQKKSGQQMSQDAFDYTLQSIGVDTVDLDLSIKLESAVDSDSELDLPWEGIQD